MEKVEFTASMVRTLKGAPISCLMVMAIVGKPVNAEYLERNTGYSDKPIASALLLLEEYGLITRNERYAWRIAINVRQLPLMVLPDENELESQDQTPEIPEPESNNDITNMTRNYSESEKFRVLSSSRSIDLTTKELTDLPLLVAADPEKLRVDENLAACDRYGIGEPKRSQISKSAQVFSRAICYHCEKVKQEGQKIGAAIYRIEHDWKVPEDWSDPREAHKQNVCAQTFSQSESINPEREELWSQCLESVRTGFKRAEFETWLRVAKLIKADENGWTIKVGNRHAAEWINDHALQTLESAAGVKIKVEW